MWVGRLGFDSDSDTEGWHFAVKYYCLVGSFCLMS